MKRLWFYFIYLLAIWGSFRYFVHLPDAIEELWFKPILWITPLFWWNLSLKKKMVMFGNKWVETSLWGLGIAIVYWLAIRKMSLSLPLVTWDVIGVAIATAVTEEITFSGFILGYLEKISKGKVINLLLVGVMAGVVRLPIIFFVYKLSLVSALGVFLLASASTMINAWIRQRTNNVMGSVIARVGLNLALLG